MKWKIHKWETAGVWLVTPPTPENAREVVHYEFDTGEQALNYVRGKLSLSA